MVRQEVREKSSACGRGNAVGLSSILATIFLVLTDFIRLGGKTVMRCSLKTSPLLECVATPCGQLHTFRRHPLSIEVTVNLTA